MSMTYVAQAKFCRSLGRDRGRCEFVKTSGPTGSPAGAGTLDSGSLSIKERETVSLPFGRVTLEEETEGFVLHRRK